MWMHVTCHFEITGRNPTFNVWMHLWMAECCVPFLGLCNLNLDRPLFLNNCDQNISLILFEVGIQIWCVNASWDDGMLKTVFLGALSFLAIITAFPP